MKITQKQINNAYASLLYLSNLKLPVKIAFDLYKTMKVIEENFNFYIEQEKKLILHYHGMVNDNGFVSFSDEETATNFKNEMEELINLEYDLDLEPIEIELDAINDQKISVADMKKLDNIVVFK